MSPCLSGTKLLTISSGIPTYFRLAAYCFITDCDALSSSMYLSSCSYCLFISLSREMRSDKISRCCLSTFEFLLVFLLVNGSNPPAKSFFARTFFNWLRRNDMAFFLLNTVLTPTFWLPHFMVLLIPRLEP